MSVSGLTLTVPEPLPSDTAVGKPQDDRVRVEFIDAQGDALADPLDFDVPETVFVEGRGSDEGLVWSPTTPDLAISSDVPADTASIRISRGGNMAMIALSDASDATPRTPDARQRFPEGGQGWTLAVVSERFDNQVDFFAHAASLHAFIAGQAPFSDADVSFVIEALFWASDTQDGLFGANDGKIADRVLAGDGKRVVRFVDQAGVAADKILVIVDSSHRAGAGGQDRRIPSWTTITASAREPWEAIALHELGHAFGLADEYDVTFDLEEPDPLEPNISKERDPARTSWHALATVAAPPAPTALRGQESGFPLATVGTFQGARYREDDRFRASPNCRMRITTLPFCPVCRAHIRAELLR